jgi:3-oxoacyl-[acyl-carrier-protein] synthase-3
LQKTRFESIGIYLPENEMTTGELVGRMTNPPVFDLEQITGIKKRRVKSESDSTYSVAVNAAIDCFSRSKYLPQDIDVIISASICRTKEGTKGYFEPPISIYIKEKLKANNAITFDITNACAGMTTGAYILDNMIRAGVVKNGIVISGECITHIADTAVREICEPVDDQFASLTVGDSGAAFIMDTAEDESEGIDFMDFATCATYSDLCIGMPSEKGVGMAMYTRAQEMHKKDVIGLWPIFLDEVLEKQNLTYDPSHWDYIITHQVSVGTIKAYLKAAKNYFEKDMPADLRCVEECGNTSTTSHFVVLSKFLKDKTLKKGDRILIVTTASGLVCGFISFKLGKLEV